MSDSHVFDPTILREYDIRGVVGDTLDAADVRAVGRAMGTTVARDGGGRVAVGRDGRLSSSDLEAALVEGLLAAGMAVTRIGQGPSPMLYYATASLDQDAGIMITGSHNPPDYNGIKIMWKGQAFYGEMIQALGRLAAAGDFVRGRGRVRDHDIREAYVARLREGYQGGGRELAVAWDPGNGATGDVVQALCARLPGRHVLINAEVDGTFPSHHPDPTVEANLVQLKAAVAAERCDLGFAFDGDGDRIGVVDATGHVLWGDQLLVILAREVLREVPGAPIIADVKASQVLFDEVARMGGQPIMWRTGHSLIKSKMAETGAPLAGEMSGHIFFSHRWYGFDDAIYAALRLLSILSRSGEDLASLREAMPQTVHTPELRFPCEEGRKFAAVDEVRERLAGTAGIEVDDTDGVRVKTADGWWLLRASNTQPVLVARCEAGSAEGLERLKANLVRQLQASGLEPPAFD